MKILQINAVEKTGSTGRACQELCDYAEKHGHECVTVYSVGSVSSSEKGFRIGNAVDAKIHAFLSRLLGLQGYFSKTSTKKLLRYMKNFSPDIIILGNLHANYIHLPMLLKYLSRNRIATVVVLHDCWFYTGKCCHYTVCGCDKWKNRCGSCPMLKKYNRSWFFDRTAKMQADKQKLFSLIPQLGVIGVSDWITNEAKQSTIFKNSSHFRRIYNWIDIETFQPHETGEIKKQWGLNDKQIILCAAYSWDVSKGLSTVLKIAEKLTDNEKIVLVGNISSSVSLGDNIIHVPATDSAQELAKLYSMADVFLQPSLEESFGKVSAEALACGTPVVCFNSTANPELINQNCGEIADGFSAESMLTSIRLVLKNGKSYYTDACRTFAVKSFEKESNIKEYFSFFDELLTH